jgi:hypothetical protein
MTATSTLLTGPNKYGDSVSLNYDDETNIATGYTVTIGTGAPAINFGYAHGGGTPVITIVQPGPAVTVNFPSPITAVISSNAMAANFPDWQLSWSIGRAGPKASTAGVPL